MLKVFKWLGSMTAAPASPNLDMVSDPWQLRWRSDINGLTPIGLRREPESEKPDSHDDDFDPLNYGDDVDSNSAARGVKVNDKQKPAKQKNEKTLKSGERRRRKRVHYGRASESSRE